MLVPVPVLSSQRLFSKPDALLERNAQKAERDADKVQRAAELGVPR